MASSQASERETGFRDVEADKPLAGTNDEARLAQLGHKQELERGFSVLALSSLVLTLMATWEALSSVISSALVSGGAPCLIYNYILAFIGTVSIVLSLSEIASIYPTAGGQYHWVAVLAPPKWRAIASWATGWISISGQIVLAASAAFSAGLQLQALIVINNESYDRPRWQGMLFYWAILTYAAAFNLFGIKLLPGVNLASGILHIAGLVALTVVLGVMSEKNSDAFVFTETANRSGWTNDGVSWLIGLQSAVYPMLGYDAACHLAEELRNPSRNVPLAMLGGTVVNGVLGFGYAILLLYSTSPLEALLETPTGFPFIQVFLDVTKSKPGAIVMSLIPSIIAVAAAVGGLTSASRTLWAFARDNAVPAYFDHVNSRLRVPARAVVLVFFIQLLLGLLYLGNVTAYNAVLSLSIVGSYLSFLIPIWYMFFYGRSKKRQYGSFTLPKVLGSFINLFSMIWISLVVIFSMFPLSLPVEADNMNYTSVVLVGWGVLGVGYYLGHGRMRFRVPYQEIQVLDDLQGMEPVQEQAKKQSLT